MTTPVWARPDTDLSTRTALVVGGAGGVGEGIVRALLGAGATVVAAGRSSARLDDLVQRLASDGAASDRLRTAELDGLASDLDDSVDALVSRIGGLDLVVVSIGTWGEQGRKPVLALTDEEWQASIALNQTAVFRLYRALVPTLRPDGVLVQVNGYSADIPFPGAGLVAASAAATKSLTRTIAAESGGAYRVYEVILGVVRTRAHQAQGIDDVRWLEGTDIGSHIAQLSAGTSPLIDVDLHYLLDKVTGPQAAPPKR